MQVLGTRGREQRRNLSDVIRHRQFRACCGDIPIVQAISFAAYPFSQTLNSVASFFRTATFLSLT